MELSDLMPEQPVFTIKATGKSYELRIPNLEDRLALIRMAGGQENVQAIFNQLQWDVISKIVYRLMIDKSDFMARTVDEINDDGVMQKQTITGPQMLMRAITSQDDGFKMIGALTAALTGGEPLVKEYVEGEIKKKGQLRTGLKSSTSSPVNMATPPQNSELSLSGS